MGTTPTTPNRSKSSGCVASATGECIARTDRLIAAAPALLEALEAVMRLVPDDIADKVAGHKARAAIRAAKSEAGFDEGGEA